ncbi:DNA recombination protein RmuC [Parvularcula sp. ZS-1/3]|uniref:DNA recombination protein RmuC homolog n=1 Tax=Parvularcula mediterranea TaxID=2732508 RepID=A0A7Y3W5B6_9PROT|nr:DNA recombination protein RmuC [Parvularcula mediterranea]NNU16132.1 DNA recombination protein RmuC [Parvularcula mediterranea]
MARFVNLVPGRTADIRVDEELEDVEGVLEQLTGASEAMSTSDMILYGILGILLLGVIIALVIVYGRINRNKDMYEDGEELFDQRFDVGNDTFDERDDFSSIRITRDQPSEPGPLLSQDDPFETVDDDLFAGEPAENVVPLRQAEPEPEMEPMQRAEPEVRSEPMPMAASGDMGRDFEQTQPRFSSQETERQQPAFEPRQMAGRYDDDDQPFVAPFIRDYIEESERRQHARLDDLRDDVRRQLSGIREEQSSRLDLFLNSIDRKLNRNGLTRSDDEDGASTRRRIDSLSTVVDRMNDALERQGERLADLTRSFEERISEMSPVRSDVRSVHDDILGFRRDVEQNTTAIGQIRDNFDSLKEDFGRMERSFFERASTDQSVTMRLSEVVRGTLDDDDYQLNAKLSNGQTADCLIILRGGRSRIAVDGSFPIECFNRLPSRDAVRRNMPQAKASEDEFRRTVLRSIFNTADRNIVAGETADSAILFLPSEAAYTILHDRFPDLVRDSHRARVWLTSPSTLMGTLNLLHNVLPASDEHEPADVEEHDFEAEGPYYASPYDEQPRAEPSIRSRRASDPDAERASDIEERLRALREEEQALAEELVRRRDTGQRRYRAKPATRREEAVDDFESRLERFSFDIEDDRVSFESEDDDDSRRSFKGPREDDLR